MNTKKKTIAIMLTAIMVSAVAVPMAMAQLGDVTVDVSIENIPPVIHQKWETQTQGDVTDMLVGIKSLKCLIDDVNIGDEASETDHALAGWGPIEPATNDGNWGPTGGPGGDDGNCRVTWEPPEDEATRGASFTMANPGLNAHQLLLRVLDGLADDSFEVKINGISAYTYTGDKNGIEEWKTHKIYLDDSGMNTEVINIEIISTGLAWTYFSKYGQLGVTWAKLFSDCCCEVPVGVVPGDPATINKFAIVSDDNGADTISKVIVKVYYPNGTLMHTQELIDTETGDAANVTIDASPLCEDDKLWKKDLIGQGEVLYKGSFTMDYTYPHGDYKMVYDVIDDAGLVDSLANDIYYKSVVILEIDFDTISYGTVKPGENTWVYGDDVNNSDTMLGPASIHNGGNDPMNVKILASEFTGPGGSIIPADAFDADVNNTGSQLLGPDAADFEVRLEYCNWVPVDFSAHVPIGTQAGAYSGTITLVPYDADLL